MGAAAPNGRVTATSGPAFLFDNNMPPGLAVAMQALHESVFHLKERFAPNTADEVWLPAISAAGEFFVTWDYRLKTTPAQCALIRRARAGGFILRLAERGGCELTQQLIRQWPLIKRTARTTPRPFLFGVRSYGQRLQSLLTK